MHPSHVWSATINNRTNRRSGCPACAGRVATATTSLGALHPEIAAEWHPTRNAPLGPDDVPAGTHRRVWWRCATDPAHAWAAPVWRRVARGGGCPICNNRIVTATTSLRARRPDFASEWHPAKNEGLTPDYVVPGSRLKVWWRCPRNPNHAWPASVADRVKGTGCPLCLGRRARARPSPRRLRAAAEAAIFGRKA